MKCKHGHSYCKGYVKCDRDGSVRKIGCEGKCGFFERTFFAKLKHFLNYGEWR